MVDFNDLTSGLRLWQAEALKKWDDSNRRAMVEVVTGGGKTRFALAAASSWLRDIKTDDPAVVVVVPTTALQDQWYVNLISDLELTRVIFVSGQSEGIYRANSMCS